jgi:hypothetical protein
LFLKLRQWDYIASKRVDINLANSLNTANRIWKYYKKKAEVLYPPIEVDRFSTSFALTFQFEGKIYKTSSY